MTRSLTLLCALLVGCSAGPQSLFIPGKSARDAIKEGAKKAAPAWGITESQGACVGEYLSRNMSDAEVQKFDAAIAGGTSYAAGEAVIRNGIASCTK
jgi:hypothetical protein